MTKAFQFVPAKTEFMQRWMRLHASSHTLGQLIRSLVCSIGVQHILRNEKDVGEKTGHGSHNLHIRGELLFYTSFTQGIDAELRNTSY